MRLLVAEDHAELARSLVEGLREEGYAVDVAGDGDEALHLALSASYDCILLDIMLPGKDGWAILSALRGAQDRSPVICLTARDGLADRINGLDLGADDYMVKPFVWSELLARIRAVIRRSSNQASTTLTVGDLELDTTGKRVTRAGKVVNLAAKEYALLEYLLHHAGKVVSRAELNEHLYDHLDEINSNVIDVYIRNLRKKIDSDHEVKLIHTRRGHGYVLTDKP